MTLMKTLAMATALALPATAGLAQGTEHRVLVERWGYFPTPIYVHPGDTIVFENAAPNWVNFWTADPNDNLPGYDWNDPCDINDPDGDDVAEYAGDADGFSTPWFNIGQTRTINVTACMETRFSPPDVWNFTEEDTGLIDLIIFGDAPNGN